MLFQIIARQDMRNIKNKQQGSFFAEISAVIACIAILTLIGSQYMTTMQARAQVSEAFVLSQPLIDSVNDFYASHGKILASSTVTDAGNYASLDMYDNSANGNTPADKAGRFVQDVVSYNNGVVEARMAVWFNDSTASNNEVGQVDNVNSAIQGESIFFIPFYIGETISGLQNEATSLRWACATTIDANPPTGSTLAPLSSSVANMQYYYAPGCVIISDDQAEKLRVNNVYTAASGNNPAIENPQTYNHNGPINWNYGVYCAVTPAGDDSITCETSQGLAS